MKKRFLAIVIFVLTFCFALGGCGEGCGCVSTKLLDFKSDYFASSKLHDNYTETLTYSVKHDGIIYPVSSSLDESAFAFQEGTYVTTLRLLSTYPEEIDNDIKKELNNSKVFEYVTRLEIPVTYNLAETKTFTDVIETRTIFCSQEKHFSPLYSITTANYSMFYQVGETKSVQELSYVSTVTYGVSAYKQVMQTGDTIENNEYNYVFGSLIDNNQLLFAIRNISVEDGSPVGLPVVSTSMPKSTSIAVVYKNADVLKFNSEDVKVTKLAYCLNSTKESGKEHFVFVQNNTDESSLGKKAYVVRYVQPLTAYGSFESMGSLVFDLKTAVVS